MTRGANLSGKASRSRADLLPASERIARVAQFRAIYFQYPVITKAIESINRLLMYGTLGTVHGTNAEAVLIYGPPGSGKSRLLDMIAAAHPPFTEQKEWGELEQIPVLVVSVNAESTPLGLAAQCLEELNVVEAYDRRESLSGRMKRLVKHIKRLGVKCIIFDELHNVDHSTFKASKKVTSDFFKVLLNKANCVLVLSGTDLAKEIVQGHPELKRRVVRRHHLARFRWMNEREKRSFIKLLEEFQKAIPLPEPSDISSVGVAYRIHFLAEGAFGNAADIVRRAVETALDMGETSITHRVLREMAEGFRTSETWLNPFDVSDDKLPMDKPKSGAQSEVSKPGVEDDDGRDQ